MLNNILLVFRYFKFLLRSKSKKTVKLPFARDLMNDVLLTEHKFYAFEEIEGIRSALKKNQSIIKITDFGAGSRINGSNERKISDIAKNSAKAPKLGEILFKLVRHFKPQNMIELGTSLGISGCYQYGGNKSGNFTTYEGCPETAKVAARVFHSFDAENAKIIVGDFKETLPTTIHKIESADYVFFDGNHQKQPTLDYFNILVEKSTVESLFVFDDIHWSAEMEDAWKQIKKHPKVTLTIDLFWIGLVFFKKELPKENINIRTSIF